MNKLVKGLLAGGAVLLLTGACAMAVYAVAGKEIRESRLVSDKIELDDFDKLDISTTSTDVTITVGDRNARTYRTIEELAPQIKENDGRLTIISENKKKISLMTGTVSKQYMELTVTKDKLAEVQAKAASGDVTIKGISFAGSVETTSGDIDISGNTAESLRLEATSGDVKLSDSVIADLSVKTTSGETELRDVSGGRLDLEAASGDMLLDRCVFESIGKNQSSGNITLKNTAAADMDMKSSSGDTELLLRGSEQDYNYDLTVTSGDIKVAGSSHEGRSYKRDNGADKNIRLESTSGEQTISFIG